MYSRLTQYRSSITSDREKSLTLAACLQFVSKSTDDQSSQPFVNIASEQLHGVVRCTL